MRSRRFLVGAMAALVGGLAPAQGPTRGTGLVVVGRIEAVRALELGPCPDDPDRDEGTEARGRVAAPTCGSFLVVEVRPQEFLRGARRDRLEIRFPRVPDERELAGAHAVAFLERRGDELWVAEGRAGLVTSAEPFPESGIDRLRTALAVRADGSEGDASGPPDDAPRTIPADQSITYPKAIKKVKPDYPEIARQARASGRVIVNAVIDRAGYVRDIRLLKSDRVGWGLEIAAVRALSQWEFEPARKDGVPVDVYFTLHADFTLDGSPEELDEGESGPGPLLFGPRAVEEAMSALVTTVPLEVPGEVPPVDYSEERAIRWAFARLVKASLEGDLAAIAGLVHSETLEATREAVLEWAARSGRETMLEDRLGTSDLAALRAMSGREMWMRLEGHGRPERSEGGPRLIFLGVVVEGDDLRHVLARLPDQRPWDGGRIDPITFKRDGSAWKLHLPPALHPPPREEGEGRERGD